MKYLHETWWLEVKAKRFLHQKSKMGENRKSKNWKTRLNKGPYENNIKFYMV